MTTLANPTIKAEELLNYVAIKITMMKDDEELAIGTAFFYEYMNSSFLVTNWHNVSGREPDTNVCKHSRLLTPNKLVLDVPRRGDIDGVASVYWTKETILLYRGESIQKPIWHELERDGKRVDVAAIAVRGLEHTAIIHANSPSLKLDNVHLLPGLDVFTLGYPVGMAGGGNWPIWKRGSIASNPEIDIDGLPKVYIDTATRQGMSGAPVFVHEIGFWAPENATHMRDFRYGVGRKLLGIYSGRVGDDSFQAQLGVVWKTSVIEEVVACAMGDHLFDDPLPPTLGSVSGW